MGPTISWMQRGVSSTGQTSSPVPVATSASLARALSGKFTANVQIKNLRLGSQREPSLNFVAGAGFEPATSGTIWPPSCYFGMPLVSFGCLDLHGDRLAADLATLPVASGRLGVDRPVPDGFSMGARTRPIKC